jgi:hypothetical protein
MPADARSGDHARPKLPALFPVSEGIFHLGETRFTRRF